MYFNLSQIAFANYHFSPTLTVSHSSSDTGTPLNNLFPDRASFYMLYMNSVRNNNCSKQKVIPVLY